MRGQIRGLSWGFVDQAFSSATNFGLSLVAGRALGARGLGIVTIGFSSYQVAFGFQRSLLSEPLVTASASLPPEGRLRIARFGLTVGTIGALAASGLLAVLGAAISGSTGQGLLLISPWLLPVLLQDYWRTILFRDGRGGAAALNDGSWLAVMIVTAPVPWLIGSEWAVFGWWGIGAAVAAALGFWQTHVPPAPVRPSWRWWRAAAWPLGRWLAVSTTVYSLTSYATVILLVALLGARQMGGLQAVTVVFGPLSLVGAAISLPSLPALSRALAISSARARTLALQLSFVSTCLVGAYFALLSLDRSGVLGFVFGHSFKEFSNLVWPVGVAQLLSAPAGGFELLLTAQQRGRAYVVSGAIGQIASLGLVAVLASTHGLIGAAWGLAGGAALKTVARVVLALREESQAFAAPSG